MLKSFLLCAFITIASVAAAQQLSHQVVNATGGFGQLLGNYFVEYTVGEPITTTLNGPATILTQGFLQPQTSLIIPVELLFFDAQLLGTHTAHLTWATSSERNAAYFGVEKSLNGRDFKELGQVKAVGQSSKTTSYFFDDALLSVDRVVYYRLKQVDADAAFKYTKIVAVYLPTTGKESQVKVYPNPAVTTITVESMKPIKWVNIYNIQGVLLRKSASSILDISDCAAGIYVLEVENTEGGTSKIKFIKKQ